MSLAAVRLTQLRAISPRPYYLLIGGVDFIAGMAPIIRESIDLTEEGPGGVSSLRFIINDPTNVATFALDSPVSFWDIANDRPEFTGWVQNVTIRPTAVGRYIDVECIGIEAALDWMLLPVKVYADGSVQPLTIKANTELAPAIAALIYNATGIGVTLRTANGFDRYDAYGTAIPYDVYGSLESPTPGIELNVVTQYDLTFEGSSLREAINQVATACTNWDFGASGVSVTVDFYGNVRAFIHFDFDSTGILNPYPHSDYSDLTINDTSTVSAPTQVAAGEVEFHLDAASVVRGVYVQGANLVGSGLISDGTGTPGPISYISDDTSTTSAIRDSIAANYLGGFSQSIRATAGFHPMPAATIAALDIRPTSSLYYHADSQVMATTTRLAIYAIHKTFSTVEDWSVDFGGMAPSAVKQTRRLTRTTRS